MYSETLRCGHCCCEMEGAYTNLQLFDNPTFHEHGQFTQTIAPEVICCGCADELSPVIEVCNFNCLDCEAVKKWSLNTRSCLNLQRELGFISDEERDALDFVKPWLLVNCGRDIGAEILLIKHDIFKQRRLSVQECRHFVFNTFPSSLPC